MSYTNWRRAKFIASATSISNFNKILANIEYSNKLPEFAFIGRSNVGKSSLINTLLDSKSLARVSKTPGCTSLINIFDVDKKLYLIDLPGYGYAKRSISMRIQWQNMILDYISKSNRLKMLFILIDHSIGHQDSDIFMIDLCQEYGIPYREIYTKSAKKMKNKTERISELLHTDATSRHGIKELRQEIETFFT